VELLSLLADRVCSGAHAEAARAHRRADVTRRALRQKVDAAEASTRAVVRASLIRFGGKRTVKRVDKSVQEELLDEVDEVDEESEESDSPERLSVQFSEKSVPAKRTGRELVRETEDAPPRSKGRRGRAKGKPQRRKASNTSAGHGRALSAARVPVHGLIAMGAYRDASQREAEGSTSTDEDGGSADSDGSLRSISGEEDGSESADGMEVETE
jgi:hypothetical protein